MILTGELIEVKDNVMQMVAVDMYRISYKSTNLPEGSVNSKAIVPAKALNELSRMLPSGENDEVSIQLTDKRIIFRTSNFTLASNLLEGEFVRYDLIFNEDFITMVEVNRTDLLSALERAVLIATEAKMPSVKLEINNDDLIISTSNERGETEDGIPCKTDGKALVIYFNPRYFIEALRAVEDENIFLKFNTQLSPCTIRGTDENTDYKYLIVPVRAPED
jgi:DNA polymerase-3 subunit beta